jgi:hypothetical protein
METSKNQQFNRKSEETSNNSAAAKSSILLYIWPQPPHLIKTTSANTSKTGAHLFTQIQKKNKRVGCVRKDDSAARTLLSNWGEK